MKTINIEKYKPEWKQRFIELNTDWIKTYFKIEEHDVATFADIEGGILADGGEIYFAVSGGVPIGCCALIHHGGDNALGEWELAKMAVDSSCRGLGIGSKLMAALMADARRKRIKRIYLEGNTQLEASIAMYRKFGFREIPIGKQSYERVDIIMVWEE